MNEEVTMFRLIRSITLKQCFTEQIPALVGAAVIAEVFYKLHSFVLEAGAFLATWFVLDMLLQGVAWLLAGKKPVVSTGAAKRPENATEISGVVMKILLLPDRANGELRCGKISWTAQSAFRYPAIPLLVWFALAILGCREAAPSQPVPDAATPTPRAAVGTGQTPPLLDAEEAQRPDVTCVALSPDGKLGLSVMGDIMTLWSLPGGKALRRFEPLPKDPLPIGNGDVLQGNPRYVWRFVYQLVVNWEHRVAATGDGNGLLRIWNLTTGALMREIQGTERKPDEEYRSATISALALSADGARVYSSGTELHPAL
jgi:hypothetical protein